MITGIAYDGYVEVKIVAETFLEFDKDLQLFKKLIKPEDRAYHSHKKVWVVKHPERYTRVPFIRNALLDREQQLSLF